MPVFEFACRSETCKEYAVVEERYMSTADKPNPLCSCGVHKSRLISRFGVVWSGPITGKYLDRKVEGGEGDSGAHWAWRTKGPDGQKLAKAEPVYIENFQQQREFAKSEGLICPTDIGPAEVHSDGKGISTRGMPGCW